jgi:hypothetical protein
VLISIYLLLAEIVRLAEAPILSRTVADSQEPDTMREE